MIVVTPLCLRGHWTGALSLAPLVLVGLRQRDCVFLSCGRSDVVLPSISGRMVDGSVRQTILLPVNLIPAATTTRIRLALLTHLPTGLLPSSEPPQAPDARFSLSHWSSSGDYPADQLAPLLRRQHLKLACSQLQQLGSFEEDPIEQAWFFQEGGSVPTVV